MLKIRYSSKFKKDYKTIMKRGYTYPLTNEELSTYLPELEENLFEKNPFSTGDPMVYSREFNGENQNISIQISQK